MIEEIQVMILSTHEFYGKKFHFTKILHCKKNYLTNWTIGIIFQSLKKCYMILPNVFKYLANLVEFSEDSKNVDSKCLKIFCSFEDCSDWENHLITVLFKNIKR